MPVWHNNEPETAKYYRVNRDSGTLALNNNNAADHTLAICIE